MQLQSETKLKNTGLEMEQGSTAEAIGPRKIKIFKKGERGMEPGISVSVGQQGLSASQMEQASRSSLLD